MRHFKFGRLVPRPSWSHSGTQTYNVIIVFCLAMLVSLMLASCGSAATAQTNPLTPTPTPTFTPTPTPSPTPTPLPTPTPRPSPTPVPVPTHQPTVAPQPTPPPAAPPILDVRPSSMSIVGHLDCQRNGAYVCFARVLSRADAQTNLNWFAYTNVPGNIVFSPIRGVLAPGQSMLITITIPFNDCTPGLFFFHGPVNTHTITWAC